MSDHDQTNKQETDGTEKAGDETSLAEVRDLNSAQPYRTAATNYHSAGWFPFPLQPRNKEPWAKGVTGRKNAFPIDEAAQIAKWCTEAPRQANIGLWLRDDIIGVDVDHYESKRGGDTFARLEAELGALPPTWISTARADGISGIRFFRIPAKYIGKLQWSGKAGDCVDIIQTGHRYAAVWPSWNPKANGQYLWYPPGSDLNGQPDRWQNYSLIDAVDPGLDGGGSGHVVGGRKRAKPVPGAGLKRVVWGSYQEFPAPADFPELPMAWVEFLTRGMVPRTEKPIDMDSTADEIEKWAKANFRPAFVEERMEVDAAGVETMRRIARPCKTVMACLRSAKKSIQEDASSHDKITDAHWNILMCGIEGHSGALRAATSLEKFWTDNVLRVQKKRGLREAAGELFRSRVEALRKIKGKADEMALAGADVFGTPCACFDPTQVRGDGSQFAPVGARDVSDPSEYEMNDDGNAKHLVELWKGQLIWVPGYGKWMFWTGKRWQVDEDGQARRCFWGVKQRQQAYADTLWARAKDLEDSGANENDIKRARRLADKWSSFALHSGDNASAMNALKAAQAIDAITMQAEALDAKPNLLGVKNGVLELTDNGYRFRQAIRDDFVTMNTEVDFMYRSDLERAGGEIAKGRIAWNDYLDLFLPDLKDREFAQKVLGYCLLGGNPDRYCVFLIGETSTGKTTMLNVIMAALGRYAATVNLSIFTDRKNAGGPNPEMIRILPARVITASEAGMAYFNAEVFKKMVGNDYVSERQMHSPVMVERRPDFTPVIATNSAPNIPGADEALVKRILTVPFRTRVSQDQDRKIAGGELERFSREAALHWLVEGWAMYAREGLDMSSWSPSAVSEKQEFVGDLSYELSFINECIERLTPDPALTKGQQSVPVHNVYDRFVAWSAGNGGDVNRIATFRNWTKLMKANGFVSENVALPKPEVGSPKQYPYISLRKLEGSELVTKFNSQTI